MFPLHWLKFSLSGTTNKCRLKSKSLNNLLIMTLQRWHPYWHVLILFLLSVSSQIQFYEGPPQITQLFFKNFCKICSVINSSDSPLNNSHYFEHSSNITHNTARQPVFLLVSRRHTPLLPLNQRQEAGYRLSNHQYLAGYLHT